MKKTKISNKTFPPKTFNIDLSNTSFSFLSKISPKPKVTVYFTSKNSRYHDYDIKGNNTLKSKNQGNIFLQLKDIRVHKLFL